MKIEHFYSSDATLVSLEPLECPDFDTCQLSGMSSSVLHDLMQLTFISDEKHQMNPLAPLTRHNR